MGFQEAISSGFDHYTKFDGRASRAPFWYWVLFAFLASIVANIVDQILGTGFVISSLLALGLLLPGLSVTIRRLHDTGHSGWWVLLEIFLPILGFIILIFMSFAQEGDPNANEYGPPPPPGGVSDGSAAAPAA